MPKPRLSDFFRYARERHQIYLNRAAGKPRPWTKDPILDQYRFTNVFRELDKTTEWFRKNVREPMRHTPDVLLATVVFRMLNRIEVGEAVFCQRNLDFRKYGVGKTAFELYLEHGDTKLLKSAIVSAVGKRGPYVTGAYIISSPPGLPKLDGVLDVIGGFRGFDWDQRPFDETSWYNVAKYMRKEKWSLEHAFDMLKQVPYFGSFHSYEIVTDLRHTDLLCEAEDIYDWANVGPGAARGLNRIYGRGMSDRGKRSERVDNDQMIGEMRDILWDSRNERLWPKDWPEWELRDVEHTLCEFDKYERARLGQGRPRGVYR